MIQNPLVYRKGWEAGSRGRKGEREGRARGWGQVDVGVGEGVARLAGG